MLFAARQRLVGQRLQPRLVGGGTVLSTLWVTVEQLDDFGEAGSRPDARTGRGDFGTEIVEVGPRLVVHLLWIEICAQHRPHPNSVALGPAAVVFVRVGGVLVA